MIKLSRAKDGSLQYAWDRQSIAERALTPSEQRLTKGEPTVLRPIQSRPFEDIPLEKWIDLYEDEVDAIVGHIVPKIATALAESVHEEPTRWSASVDERRLADHLVRHVHATSYNRRKKYPH
jgi:glutamate-1-semialdehyde aminotransferase